MVVLDSFWVSTLKGETIGIVKCQDEKTKEVKFYMGVVSGYDQYKDEKYIMEYGTPIHPEMIKHFFRNDNLETENEGN